MATPFRVVISLCFLLGEPEIAAVDRVVVVAAVAEQAEPRRGEEGASHPHGTRTLRRKIVFFLLNTEISICAVNQ